jgi:hypothetical protein
VTNLRAYPVWGSKEQYGKRRVRFFTNDDAKDSVGMVASRRIDMRSIDLWIPREDGRLLWGATCKSTDPDAARELWPNVVENVMAEFEKRGIVAVAR